MTRYMLDTNIISDLIRNPQGGAAKRIAKVGVQFYERAILPELKKRPKLNSGPGS